MLFGHCIKTHVATDVIIYKLIENVNPTTKEKYSYSIWKCNTMHDTRLNVIDGIRNKAAVDLIWNDVVNGLQK